MEAEHADIDPLLTACAEGLARLAGLMTQEEWLALDVEHFKRSMSPRMIAAPVPWAAYGVPRSEQGRIFAEAGLGFKLVWLATRRRFAIREARTFRYA